MLLTFICITTSYSFWDAVSFPALGLGQNGVSILRRSHPQSDPLWTFVLVFYSCCPLSGVQRWTTILILTNRSSSSSINPSLLRIPFTFSKHSIISKSLLPFCKSMLSLLLIFSLLIISGDVLPNPSPAHPCSSIPVVSPGKTGK